GRRARRRRIGKRRAGFGSRARRRPPRPRRTGPRERLGCRARPPRAPPPPRGRRPRRRGLVVIKAVVFDLDGVVRHFAPAVVARIEQRHGLAAGVIPRAAFTTDLLVPLTTG